MGGSDSKRLSKRKKLQNNGLNIRLGYLLK